MINDYPRILFVNIIFQADNSAGITISKLVTDIPNKNLFILDQKFEKIIDYSFKSKGSIKKVNRNINGLIKMLSSIMGSKSYLNKISLSNKLIEQIKSKSIDFLYLVPSTLAVTLFVLKIKRKIPRIKIIVHVLDDKVNAHYKGILGFFYKIIFRKKFIQLVRKANIRMSISDYMSEVYKKEYNYKFYSFHNSIEIEKWGNNILNKNRNFNNSKDISILYTGAIESNYDTIVLFCDVVNRINKKSNYNIKFILHSKFASNKYLKKIDNYPFTLVNGYLSQAELPKLLSSHDFLLLPLSFNKKMQYIKLSMPTKATEYMMSGTPIIVLAPKDTALVKYSSRFNWAINITTTDYSKIEDSIIEILENKDNQEILIKNANRQIYDKHDINKEKEKFKKILFKDYEGKYVQK